MLGEWGGEGEKPEEHDAHVWLGFSDEGVKRNRVVASQKYEECDFHTGVPATRRGSTGGSLCRSQIICVKPNDGSGL